MKVAIILIAVSVYIIGINAVCDQGACGTLNLNSNCTQLKTYVSCLQKEADGCKATAGDIAAKVAIEAMIATAKTTETFDGCGACAVTVSLTTLLISLVAAYVKM